MKKHRSAKTVTVRMFKSDWLRVKSLVGGGIIMGCGGRHSVMTQAEKISVAIQAVTREAIATNGVFLPPPPPEVIRRSSPAYEAAFHGDGAADSKSTPQ